MAGAGFGPSSLASAACAPRLLLRAASLHVVAHSQSDSQELTCSLLDTQGLLGTPLSCIHMVLPGLSFTNAHNLTYSFILEYLLILCFGLNTQTLSHTHNVTSMEPWVLRDTLHCTLRSHSHMALHKYTLSHALQQSHAFRHSHNCKLTVVFTHELGHSHHLAHYHDHAHTFNLTH